MEVTLKLILCSFSLTDVLEFDLKLSQLQNKYPEESTLFFVVTTDYDRFHYLPTGSSYLRTWFRYTGLRCDSLCDFGFNRSDQNRN